jgi:hypothetical protein
MNQEQQPEPPTCSICLDAINENNHTLECGHSFHPSCIIECFRRQAHSPFSNGDCPNCRRNPYREQSTPSRTNTGVIFISNDRDEFRNNYFRDELTNVSVNNINNGEDDLISNFLSNLYGSNDINRRNNVINRRNNVINIRDNNRSNSSNVIDIAGNLINPTQT